jgi:hypothetical protein
MDDAWADNYRSFLIRMWRTDATTAWRASLSDPNTSETFYFADMKSLWAFLVRLTEEVGERNEDSSESRRKGDEQETARSVL